MTDFGFSLSKSSVVDIDRTDTALYRRLCELDRTAASCMSCGSCSATCTASSYSGMSLRKVLHGLQRGEDVRPMLRCCMLCGKCTMVCPRGINTRHVLLTIAKIYD
ncbi:MAG: (4Fe-4S)-binding protein [Bacteroidales bacterium]|nr:(4Fe-4S)-binding protein [Bacteroidales bacterium]